MKIKKIFHILLTVILCLVYLTGCTEKKPVTVEIFNQIMTDAGFQITNATMQTTGDSISAISLAIKEEYQVEFYVFTQNKYADLAFQQNKSIFEGYVGKEKNRISKSIGEYDYYSLVTNGQCYILARVDNTLLYTVADDTYKNDIAKLIKELEYE